MEDSLWINSSWCGTRPNTNNFKDPNVLKDGVDNLHFRSFSISKMDGNDDDGRDTLYRFLRRIVPDRELSDTECSAATLSEGGEFVVSNVAAVRMLQKQRSFLWEIYNEFHSKKDINSDTLALWMERLWFPLFRGYVALTVEQFNWNNIQNALPPNLEAIQSTKWWPGKGKESLYCPSVVSSDGTDLQLIDTKESKMWTITEFGYELQGIVPWHFALCKNKGLSLRTYSSAGMEPYYFWSPLHHSVANQTHGVGHLPSGNPLNRAMPHLPLTAFPNATEWRMPNFKAEFSNQLFVFNNDRKTVMISNKFNTEWGKDPVNFFNVEVLTALFQVYLEKGYNIIYKRPVNNELLNDNDQQSSVLKDRELIRSRFSGQVLRYSDVIDRIQKSMDSHPTRSWMNIIQLQLMANVDEFVSVQGGNSVLSSLFCREHFILHHKGQEYGTGDYSFYPRLNSNNECILRVYTKATVMLRDLRRRKQDRISGKPCTGCTPENCLCSYIE